MIMTREEFNQVQWHKGMKAISRLRGVEYEMDVVDVDLESYKIGLNYMSTYISCDCEDVELLKDFKKTKWSEETSVLDLSLPWLAYLWTTETQT